MPLGAGAVSVTGVSEVIYNDTFTQELKTALEKAGYFVVLTRLPNEVRTLDERSAIANRYHNRPALFISIHHDSTQLENLKTIDVNGRQVYQTIRPIAGTSLHISNLNGRYSDSLGLAQAIGRQLHDRGRTVNLDHANPDYDAPLELVDANLGIYHHNNLRVLRATQIPALLIEVGVIVDKDDEALISTPSERAKLIDGITLGIQTVMPNKNSPK